MRSNRNFSYERILITFDDCMHKVRYHISCWPFKPLQAPIKFNFYVQREKSINIFGYFGLYRNGKYLRNIRRPYMYTHSVPNENEIVISGCS